MTRCAFILFALLLTGGPAYGQTSKPKPQHETWYEQALRRINPDDTDYGAIWEERKRAFTAQLGNRCFQFSLGATVAVVSLLVVTCLQRLSYNRTMDIAAESFADVIRHDEYSREVASEAIRRHDEHINACNRAIEARQEGLTKSTSATEAELQRLNQELADTRKENKALRDDLAKKSQIIAGMPPPTAGEKDQPVLAELELVRAQYMERINVLEKRLRAEQRKNQHRKGTSVDDHRA